ncbi:MAG: hypothetical protein KA059_07930 [Elusimicrobiales bacterium]|nr:hypothetical protein [Elusimicrobiales bacterium]
MSDKTLMALIKELKSPIFTTAQIKTVSGKSLSTVSQGLSFLAGQNLISKVYHGIWKDNSCEISPYSLIPYLLPRQRAYVSFITALHLYGIIEQIPQNITVASVAHTKNIKTSIGNFLIHQIEPSFFTGFVWSKNNDFLIAEPEKALADCIYLSGYKKNQFLYLPEMHFSRKFSFKRTEEYLKKINNSRLRVYAIEQLNKFKISKKNNIKQSE